MWRSLFLAVGIGLMVLGVEALIFERAEINESARLPKILNGLFEKDVPDSLAFGQNVPLQANPALQNPNPSNFQHTPYASESMFGPSRFSGPQAGNYGGGRVDLSRSGMSSNNAQPGNAIAVSFANGSNSAVAGGTTRMPSQIMRARTIVTKDWMPWSLLAAGAIVFLYTSSHGGSRSDI